VGYLITSYGSDMIVYTAIFGMAIGYLLVLRNPAVMPESTSSIAVARPKLMSLLTDSSVIRFLVLVSLIQGSHAAYYSFSTIYWKGSGHAESTIGYLWSLGVIAEIMVFAFSKRLFGGMKIQTLFAIASLGVAVRWGLTASTTNLLALVVIQALHGVTFAMAHIAAIQYIQNAQENRMVALQALYNAIPLGGFIALMTALSGWGYEIWGKDIFWAMGAMGVVALFIRVESKKSQATPQIET
jgi:PPP family 3-phenylpropionic acid transporter